MIDWTDPDVMEAWLGERSEPKDGISIMREATIECEPSDDGLHCNCWYDGEACCRCHAPALPEGVEE